MCEYSPWQNNVNDAEYLKRALATFTFIHICYCLSLLKGDDVDTNTAFQLNNGSNSTKGTSKVFLLRQTSLTSGGVHDKAHLIWHAE